MRHCDDEVLAALALGDPIDPADAEHITTCTRCAAEVEELRAVAGRIEEAADVELVAPPARVWDAIGAELAAGGGATVTRLDAVAASTDEAPAPAPAEAPVEAERDDLAARRRRPNPWFVAAAAAVAGIVVGGVGVSLLGPSDPATSVVASADLADLATEDAAGEARVERRDDGTEVLVLDTAYAAAGDANLEVWLIDPNVEGMVSLGYLTADHGEFEIPEGFDVAAYPIVDISVEPADGDPTHSGDSITRGILG